MQGTTHSKGTYTITETEDQLQFATTVAPLLRIAIGIIALIPLLAPYTLFMKNTWDFSNYEFSWPTLFLTLIALVVGLGATALSVFLFIVALFGLNRTIVFNKKTQKLTQTEKHPFTTSRRVHVSFQDIEKVTVTQHTNTDGPDYYKLNVFVKNLKPIAFGDFRFQKDAEQYKQAIEQLAS